MYSVLGFSLLIWTYSLRILSFTNNLKHHIDIPLQANLTMQSSVPQQLNVNSQCHRIEDYVERFEIWFVTNVNTQVTTETAFLRSLVGKEAYAFLEDFRNATTNASTSGF